MLTLSASQNTISPSILSGNPSNVLDPDAASGDTSPTTAASDLGLAVTVFLTSVAGWHCCPSTSSGAAILPRTAEAATTSGDAKNANASLEPILPLKFLLVADIPTSPSFNNPAPKPIQGPHPAGNGMHPASIKVFHAPSASASF